MSEKTKVSTFKKRFSDAPWYEPLKRQHVLLIGAGGIGSWVALALSRIGCDITIHDMDIVEAHNLGGQLYSMANIGQNKAQATAQLAADFSGRENAINIEGRYTEDSMSNHIVIAAFDNMSGRKLAFEKWVELMESDAEHKEEYIFLDGRLLAEDYQIYAVTHDKVEQYRATLFEDHEAPEVSCSLKSTTHCSMGIASDMTSVLTNFVTNRFYKLDIRDVPFSIIKSIPLLKYEVNLTGHAEEVPAV